MAAPASDSGGDVAMDPALWGNLQHRIDLSVIYAKLPLAPFFRLRLVCKEWNRLASDRQFLEQTFRSPITEPFFVVPSGRAGARLLTSQGSSWNSEPVPRGRHEVSGLLLVRSMRVFDLHTRVFHSLPPLPAGMQLPPLPEGDELGGEYGFRVVGMTVDKALIPYRFRVVIGDRYLGTCIFDSSSGAWTQKPSTLKESGHPFRTVCCFDTMPDALFDTMPEVMCAWMMSGSWDGDLQSNFCGELVLVHNWVGEEWRGVLYNLERK